MKSSFNYNILTVKIQILLTCTCCIESWGGNLKTSYWKVFEKGINTHMKSHIKVHSSSAYHNLMARFVDPPLEIYTLKLTMGFQQWLAHLSPLG